jgi:hypothetical protein
MWLILLFGLIALATSGWFAFRAEGRVRGFLASMSKAVGYAALASFSIDMLRVCSVVAAWKKPDERWVILVAGLSESLSPLVMGFAFLALVHFFTAIGHRRLDARQA